MIQAARRFLGIADPSTREKLGDEALRLAESGQPLDAVASEIAHADALARAEQLAEEARERQVEQARSAQAKAEQAARWVKIEQACADRMAAAIELEAACPPVSAAFQKIVAAAEVIRLNGQPDGLDMGAALVYETPIGQVLRAALVRSGDLAPVVKWNTFDSPPSPVDTIASANADTLRRSPVKK